ncbi:transposase family protein [Streptomyces sp. NPDC000618]|uniref:transposase family protein n=1 Tax=Streptomyces sp. NPDC000618 TaxID=3154265 RepID=UPI00331F0372
MNMPTQQTMRRSVRLSSIRNERTSGVVAFHTSCRTLPARCPGCGMPSWRVHGRYSRRMADAPLGLAPVVIEFLV